MGIAPKKLTMERSMCYDGSHYETRWQNKQVLSYLIRYKPMGLSVPRDGLAEVEDLRDLKHVGREIIREGLRPMRSGKVHLSRTIGDAVQVRKRKTSRPVILKIDTKNPMAGGIRIKRVAE
jgi:RNA:NAD 2'-phosphotransferase (TPT1/KptA family)